MLMNNSVRYIMDYGCSKLLSQISFNGMEIANKYNSVCLISINLYKIGNW